MFHQITSLFDQQGWNYHKVEEQNVIESGFEAHHSKVSLHIQAFPDRDTLSVVGRSSHTIRPEYLPTAGELVMRANMSLTIGAFEIDWDQGHTLFRASNIFTPKSDISTILTSLTQISIVETDTITAHLSQLETLTLPISSQQIIAILSSGNLIPDIDYQLKANDSNL